MTSQRIEVHHGREYIVDGDATRDCRCMDCASSSAPLRSPLDRGACELACPGCGDVLVEGSSPYVAGQRELRCCTCRSRYEIGTMRELRLPSDVARPSKPDSVRTGQLWRVERYSEPSMEVRYFNHRGQAELYGSAPGCAPFLADPREMLTSNEWTYLGGARRR